ncbi:MAG: transglycosylase SLT domain-containing protein [Dehalococcoidia bacterium]|nr:transglycosylase SLT domain-containing protein [Dehalococcoidia bacterium]
MAGVLTATLARSARHSLGVTGLALLVAGAVAFLPLGPTDSAASSQRGEQLAAATSIEAMRSVFTTSAEAAAESDLNPTPNASPTETAVVPAAFAAVAPPALEGGVGPGLPSATPAELVGQALVASALQQATPSATAARTAAPTTASSQARSNISLPGIEEALAQSPWPRELWPTVERIIVCESSGNPGAVSPAGYQGLMQVAPWLHGAVPADPVAQLSQAYDVYLKQGWGAWGCY